MEISSIDNSNVGEDGLFDLFSTSFIFNPGIELGEYIVTSDDEMRIDLIFRNLYDIDLQTLSYYLKDLDVILYINNIDNPLNVKEGMAIRYPIKFSDLEKFRFTQPSIIDNSSVIKQLAIPNSIDKKTRTDKSRQEYIENDYSLSPVILDTPREPVRLEGGKFSIGGL